MSTVSRTMSDTKSDHKVRHLTKLRNFLKDPKGDKLLCNNEIKYRIFVVQEVHNKIGFSPAAKLAS